MVTESMTKEARLYKGEKTVSSISGMEPGGLPSMGRTESDTTEVT